MAFVGRPVLLVLLSVLVLPNLLGATVQAQDPREDVQTRGPFEATLRYAEDQDRVVWTEEFVLPEWADWAEVELRGRMQVDGSSVAGWINVTLEVRLDGIRVDRQFQDVSTATARSVSLDAVLPSPASEADRPRYDVTGLTERTLTTEWSAEPRSADPRERSAAIEIDEIRVTYGEAEGRRLAEPWFWPAAGILFVVSVPLVAVLLALRVARAHGND